MLRMIQYLLFVNGTMRGSLAKTTKYIRDVFVQENINLSRIRESAKNEMYGVQIGSDEGKLLYTLIKMNHIKNIVEIGTMVGYSSAWMASAIPEDGLIHTIEKSAENAAIARNNFKNAGLENKITLLEGDAIDILKGLNMEYDMVFIDANKSAYCHYLDWAEEHVKKGGLIVADNTLLFDSVYLDNPPDGINRKSWTTMKNFNKRIADPSKYCSIMIPTKEGLTVGIKDF